MTLAITLITLVIALVLAYRVERLQAKVKENSTVIEILAKKEVISMFGNLSKTLEELELEEKTKKQKPSTKKTSKK